MAKTTRVTTKAIIRATKDITKIIRDITRGATKHSVKEVATNSNTTMITEDLLEVDPIIIEAEDAKTKI